MTKDDLAALGAREETHRVFVKGGELFGLGAFLDRALPDVEATALLREVEKLLIVDPDRIAVLSQEVSDLAMGFLFGVVEPDVASDRRSVMLAPGIFEAFAVVVEELLPGRGEVDLFGRNGEELGDTTSGDGCKISFAIAPGRNVIGMRGIHAGGFENDLLAIRSEGGGNVVT